MDQNTLTTAQIKQAMTARQRHWYEASFVLGFLPAIASLVVGWAGQQAFGLEPRVQDIKIILLRLL